MSRILANYFNKCNVQWTTRIIECIRNIINYK